MAGAWVRYLDRKLGQVWNIAAVLIGLKILDSYRDHILFSQLFYIIYPFLGDTLLQAYKNLRLVVICFLISNIVYWYYFNLPPIEDKVES